MWNVSCPLTVRDRLLAELSDELAALDADGLRRRFQTMESMDGPLVRLHGRQVVNWCSNDYLGLSTHPALVDAAARAAAEWGVGARASRLLAGTTRWHARLEERLAAWFGAEASVVFSSGYLANLGALNALVTSADIVFLDRLCHASLVDAARASGARLRVFPHNDLNTLRFHLARASRYRRRVIVTEGIFSMEGDRCPLPQLVELAEEQGAIIYLDDAHGAFVLGAGGRGAPEEAGVAHERLIYMGTLGKAAGCQGGFVVGSTALIDVVRNRARTFIYSTALAVPVVAAAVAALEVMAAEPHRRGRLWSCAAQLHARLVMGSWRDVVPETSSHIVPIIVGDTPRAVALAEALQAGGHWAPAIRPPTVPRGTARVRVSLTALQTEAQIDALAQALDSRLLDISPVHGPQSTVHRSASSCRPQAPRCRRRARYTDCAVD